MGASKKLCVSFLPFPLLLLLLRETLYVEALSDIRVRFKAVAYPILVLHVVELFHSLVNLTAFERVLDDLPLSAWPRRQGLKVALMPEYRGN